MDCQTMRDDLHVEPTSVTVRAHLAGCTRCTLYAQRMARLDNVLSGELVVVAPVALSTQLGRLPTPPALQQTRVDTVLRNELVVAAPDALSARLLALVQESSAGQARPVSPLDGLWREALVVPAPAKLSARLRALVPQAGGVVTAPTNVAPPLAVGPPRWVVATVYAITSALLLLSLLYAGQVYSLLIAQLGLGPWLAGIANLPSMALSLLFEYVPYARAVVGVIVGARQPLQWLLVALVMWAVIDMSQRQRASHAERTRQYV